MPTHASTPPDEPGDLTSELKALGKLVITAIEDHSGLIAVVTSLAVGASFAVVTIYYDRLLHQLGTTRSAVGFDNQEMIARALVGFFFVAPTFVLLLYWAVLWTKTRTGRQWLARLGQFAFCEAVFAGVAAFCAATDSQMKVPTAGLVLFYFVFTVVIAVPAGLVRVGRWRSTRRGPTFRSRTRGAKAVPVTGGFVCWAMVVAVSAYGHALIEQAADQDAAVVRGGVGAGSVLKVLAPYDPTPETIRRVDPAVAEAENLAVGQRVLVLAEHDGAKVLLLPERPGGPLFTRAVTVQTSSIELDESLPG